jgi:mannose-6-phosphate isomerase-like protein (cupin superfamily)
MFKADYVGPTQVQRGHFESGRLQMYRRFGLVAVLVLATLLAGGGGEALDEKEAKSIKESDPLPYVRVYSDAEGESHFEDSALPFTLVDFAPPAPPVSVSEAMAADSVAVISSPAGWHGDWHPAPRRQFMFVLAGELEVHVSDGAVRRFRPGDVLLVEDTSGKGHVSTVVGDERCFMANVALSD